MMLALSLSAPLAMAANAPETAVAPVPKPERGEATVPSEASKEAAEGEAKEPAQSPTADMATPECTAALDEAGAVYSTVERVKDADPDCGFGEAVNLSEIVPGVKLSPPATVQCGTALALSKWVTDFVKPATSHLAERGELIAIRQGSGFVCRRRNNRPDGLLSEHAFGTAIDVMGFEFDTGKPIPIQPREREGTMAEAFQDAVRASACMVFTTVLGPGSDDYHDDHLHLDIKERNGGFRLCQ